VLDHGSAGALLVLDRHHVGAKDDEVRVVSRAEERGPFLAVLTLLTLPVERPVSHLDVVRAPHVLEVRLEVADEKRPEFRLDLGLAPALGLLPELRVSDHVLVEAFEEVDRLLRLLSHCHLLGAG
jgi:hypothetical protein